MRRGHFEALRPVCPECLAERDQESPVAIGNVVAEDGEHVLEALLRCTSPHCGRLYPVFDGVPVLVPELAEYVAGSAEDMLRRDDLSAEIASVLAECAGQNTAWERTRQLLSSYGFGHYADLDPADPASDGLHSVREVLAAGMGVAGPLAGGPVVDVGCSVGRVSFELGARHGGLVLGVDTNFAMLRVAARVLREGMVRYPRRRVGMVYSERAFPVSFPGAERVDFWACDASALPFPRDTFAGAFSLNVIDSIPSPVSHLHSMARVLETGAPAVISTPYEWQVSATPMDRWIGGRDATNTGGGRSELVLRALLEPGSETAAQLGLAWKAEIPQVPWDVFMHDRGVLRYATHVVVLTATGQAPPSGVPG